MGNCWKKSRNYRFFDIFWDILDKGKGNLGQECVKRRLLIFQGKIGTTSSDFPGKMTAFQVRNTILLCIPTSMIYTFGGGGKGN